MRVRSGCAPCLPLRAPADCRPVHKILQTVAVLPGELEELHSRHVVGFFAQKRFEPPAQIRAVPGLEPVASCNDPVVVQRSKHGLALSLLLKLPFIALAQRYARAPKPNSRRAFPKFPYNANQLQSFCHPSSSWRGALALKSMQSSHAA